MAKYSYNRNYLTKDGKPFFPFMGEFHFSRFPQEYWEEEVCKMKAGGVTVLSVYIIWIHHEEEEGIFVFAGQRNLKKFLEICEKQRMQVFLRIGPWVHGEVRNGGFPDWLLTKNCELRSDDEEYLCYVERFWEQIYEQAKESLNRDGCILGIQIENEYGHVGGLAGEAGQQHMRTLTALAKRIGFHAPFWTATGWGGAVLGDLLPVMGGYCDAPWDASLEKLPPNKNYLFSTVRNDGNIGSDYGIGMELSFDKEKYPYLTAELGGGLQVVHRRRPRVCAEDIGAMSLAKMGSGCNLLGYYMYHGGTNPKGKRTSLQESVENGSACDLPEFSYDFQAPIREYGQMSDTLRELKLLALFVQDFGSEFCEMEPQFTGTDCRLSDGRFHAGEFNDAEELSSVRMITRRQGGRGYLFVNNYQRGYPMQEHEAVTLSVCEAENGIEYPVQDIRTGDYFFYPFCFPVKGAEIRWINQTPLCTINEKLWIFYGNRPLRLEMKGKLEQQTVIALTKDAAKNVWRIAGQENVLYISEAPIFDTEHGIRMSVRSDCGQELLWMLCDRQNTDFGDIQAKGWTEAEERPDFIQIYGDDDSFALFWHRMPKTENHVFCKITAVECQQAYQEYELQIKYDKTYDGKSEDVFLQIDFVADRAELYLEEEKIADQFYLGNVWEVGLKRFGFPEKLIIRIYPLDQSDEVYLETEIPYEDGACCRMNGICAITETLASSPFL